MSKLKKTFWDIWSSYAIYYFGKVNLGIVVPALLVTFKDLSLYNVGLVSSGFFFAYAIGQFLHGQISEKHNPFVYISAGLILSGIMNAILGFWGGFFTILLVGETIDGFVQAMGWSSCVRANAMTMHKDNISRSSTILGTSYQIGNSVAWLISAFAVGAWGWQAGFFVASGMLILRGVLLLITRPKMPPIKKTKALTTVKNTLTLPIILGGFGLCLLNMVRYGVITWIPLYLFQVGNLTIEQMGKVGLKVCLIPIAGVLGTLVYNKIKISKDLLSVIYLVLLAVSFIILPFTTGIGSVAVLVIGSFFLYGPHVFLVSTLPTRFTKVVGASTGFIDGMGYVGTTLIGIIVPVLITMNQATTSGGWHSVFAFWAILSGITAAFVGFNYVKSFKK